MEYLYQSKCSRYILFTTILLAQTGLSNANSKVLPKALEIITVTTERLNRNVLDTPYSVYKLDEGDIANVAYRTTADMFRDIPGAMVQKTGHGQGSPFLRGFTGFQNLFLIDGIRLNNAIFRSGPNQYWNTVDPLSLNKLEVVMGPSSALFGSDGIGGTVNAITKDPSMGDVISFPTVSVMAQVADSSNTNVQRIEIDHHLFGTGVLIGANRKDYGNISSGNDYLPNTSYDETNLDIKIVRKFQNDWKVSLAYYLTHQQDVPRTHKTIYSIPFAGTSIGDELMRDLDQKRQLTYVKLENNKLDTLSHLNVSLSYHEQDESRKRLRSRNRTDDIGISVNTIGFTLDTGINFSQLDWLFGLDFYHDNIDSYSSSNEIQGPVADDASYTTQAIFSELRWTIKKDINLVLGARYSAAKAQADKVSDPLSGLQTSFNRRWNDVVGNLRINYRLGGHASVFAGISEGFRAPNLSDLSRLDSARSNEFEIPSLNLDSEHYLSYEVGYRKNTNHVGIDFALYYTDIQNQIVLFPTGNINNDGEIEMNKSNQGDGFVYGSEILFSMNISKQLSTRIGLSYQYGRITEFPQGGIQIEEDYISRLQPLTGQASIKYSTTNWSAEAQVISMAAADKLSLRDMSDTQRIPPLGTPGFGVFNVRGTYFYSESLRINISADNLFNKNYRVHGSGQNEVGRNVIASLYLSF
jgi:hemoglobin/transferrin/lactoferrin receptor protein